MLLTRPPLASTPKGLRSFDLHVLGAPPAFVLSQDQTLWTCYIFCPPLKMKNEPNISKFVFPKLLKVSLTLLYFWNLLKWIQGFNSSCSSRMLFNFQGPIRCRFRRQLRYYITHSFHCQHLSAIFFSNLPRPRVFWVKLSTYCGKCTAFVPFAARPCSVLSLCAFPHKIRAFCTTEAAFLCGKRQIVGRFLSNAVFDNKKPASGGTQVFCLFWILKDSIVT